MFFLKKLRGAPRRRRIWRGDGDLLKAPEGATPFVIEGGLGQIVGNSMRRMKLYRKNHDGRNTAMGHGNLASRRATREREGERL